MIRLLRNKWGIGFVCVMWVHWDVANGEQVHPHVASVTTWDVLPAMDTEHWHRDSMAGVGSGAGQGAVSHARTRGCHFVYQSLAERKQGNGTFAGLIP